MPSGGKSSESFVDRKPNRFRLYCLHSYSTLTPKCNERRCTQLENWLITVSYYFPLWLWNRVIHLRARSSLTNGCMISVRTPRVVSTSSLPFALSFTGNLVGPQKIFSQGQASPFVVDPVQGQSYLHVCWTQKWWLILVSYTKRIFPGCHTWSTSRSLRILIVAIRRTLSTGPLFSACALF